MFGNTKDLRKEYDRIAALITGGEVAPEERVKLMNQKKEAFAKWYEASAPDRQAEKAATPAPRKAVAPQPVAENVRAIQRPGGRAMTTESMTTKPLL